MNKIKLFVLSSFLGLILFIIFLNGCATTRYVDAKGRDCNRHWVYPMFVWDECVEETSSLPPTKIELDATINKNDSLLNKKEEVPLDKTDLLYICSKAGLGVDFVTKNCTKSDGSQVNPYNLFPSFQFPLGKPNTSESIMRCQGKAVDFVTGKCME